MPASSTSTRLDLLDADQVTAVLAVVARAAAEDGRPPLNEAALLHLEHPRPSVQHLLASAGADIIGYAQLETGQDSPVGQVVVDPGHRRQGVGTRLVTALLDATPTALQIWAVGNTPAAQALAARTGLEPVRELLIMTRSLTEDLPEPQPGPGVRIRTFVPGADDEDWVAVNAAAFAAHPEQGALTVADLGDRMAQPWFDPAGFFVAIRSEALVGFHWTKQHEDHLGEVYVLGVAPQAAGHGLGKALLLTGLHHLKARGNTEVELYVEADQPGPVGLYRGYGFTTASRDVMYARR